MGFLDKLSSAFGTGNLASGAGSIMGGIAGIAGIRQAKKNAKLQRELMRKNFALQQEYAEKNYQLQLSQQQMQRDQFDTMVDLSDPLTQRKALENAGFNPFMDGSAIGTPNTPGSSAGSIGQVNPPQYDTSGLSSAATLQQTAISNSVGNLNGILEAAEKIAGMPTGIAKNEAELSYKKLMNDLTSKQNQEKLIDIAKKELDLHFFPSEKQSSIAKLIAERTNIETQTGLFTKQGDKIEVDKRAVQESIKKTAKEIENLLVQIEGVKKDNHLKDLSLQYSRKMYELQLTHMQSQISLNYASAYNQNQQGKKANHDMNLLDSQIVKNLTPTDYMNYSFYRANAKKFGLNYPDDVGTNLYTRLNNEFNISGYQQDALHQDQQLKSQKVLVDAAKNPNPLIGTGLGIGLVLDMLLRDYNPSYFGTNRHKYRK